jgi:hypothetical protein
MPAWSFTSVQRKPSRSSPQSSTVSARLCALRRIGSGTASRCIAMRTCKAYALDGNVLAEASAVDDCSDIFAAYPCLESLDVRTAMLLLARGVMYRSKRPRELARRWFVLWPSIPAPLLYARPAHAFEIAACAA